MLAMASIEPKNDSVFYFTATYYKDTCTNYPGVSTNSHPSLTKIDHHGNVYWSYHYVINTDYCFKYAEGLTLLQNNDIIIYGGNFVIRTNQDGDLLWARMNTGPFFAFKFIKELPNGDILAGFDYGAPEPGVEGGASLMRMDSAGNILWSKRFFQPLGLVDDALMEPDGSILVAGYTEPTGGIFEPQTTPLLFLLKLDPDGDVLWCKGYNSAPRHWHTHSPIRMVHALDGNPVLLANKGAVGYNLWSRNALVKFDLNGDTLWTRSINTYPYSQESRNLLAFSDGSYMYIGRIEGDMPDGNYSNWALLCKTDSNGHLPCREQYYPMVSMELFPTPVDFTFTTVDGAERRPAFLTPITYPPIVQYDVCELPLEVAPRPSPDGRVRIRPNPTPGAISVDFPAPLLRESFYSVIDATGRLLYERPLPPGATTADIDLSRFGKGTYILRITDPEGQRNERVVVE